MQASSNNVQSIIENAVNEASMCTTTPNWCAVFSSGVQQVKSRDAPCLGTRTPSGSRKSPQQRDLGGEIFAQSLGVVIKSERSIQLYPKICWDWTGWQYIAIVVHIKLTFGLSVAKMKGRCHRFRIAEL